MNAIQEIEQQIISNGHICSVEEYDGGRLLLKIDGDCYSPRDAAEHFILGGWNGIWMNHDK